MKKIKLAMAQVESFHGDKEKNLEKALEIIKKASKEKADIGLLNCYDIEFQKQQQIYILLQE